MNDYKIILLYVLGNIQGLILGFYLCYSGWVINRTAKMRHIDHSEHGLGDDSGPFDPDCSCRATSNEAACGKAGCGFCKEKND